MDVVSLESALERIAGAASACALPGTESILLNQAHGRVLAADIVADRDMPPFPRSTHDGYALRAAETGGRLRVLGEVRAGETWTGQQAGLQECVSIMTGAPVPDWADAVVMLEHVERTGDTIRLREGHTVATGQRIVPRGSEAHRGDRVVRAGTRLSAAHISAAAAVGAWQVPVFAPPNVSIVATGDELVDAPEIPLAHQIRNSNAPALAAAVTACGGRARVLPVARDTAASLQERIASALPCDLLLLSGGVSAGAYDLVEPVLEKEFGAEFFFRGVHIKPGKPVTFGRLSAGHGGTWFFGLPGNPLSTLVTFTVLVQPLLAAMAGERPPSTAYRMARMAHGISEPPGLIRFLPAQMDWQQEFAEVRRVPWQGSGDVAAGSAANCYLVVPDHGQLRAGDWVRVLDSI